jgi:hypothetical protein
MPDKTPSAEDRGPPRSLTLVIDRIEGAVAILADDEGGGITLPLDRLPTGPAWAEGLVIRVPLDTAGRPDWRSAQPDHAETRRRLEEGADVLKRLRERDPGGDVTL